MYAENRVWPSPAHRPHEVGSLAVCALLSAPMKPFERKGYDQYGADMGRGGSRLPEGTRVHLQRVPIDRGGYDPGGAYWGIGAPLFCASSDEDGDMYFRAADRKAALARIRGMGLVCPR
jgi:hypothetical protein